MNTENTITITQKEYEELRKDSRKLAALEAGGVDNWEWYGESLKEFWEEEED
jgi:hypothetical protein